MKLYLLALCLYIATDVATAQRRRDEPLERCSVTDCFNRDQVRDFEIIDKTTLLIYVGARRCPFLVELSGTFCDLTFLPGGPVNFRRRREEMLDADATGAARSSTIVERRICANDFSVGIDEGPFSTSSGGESAVPPNQYPCMLQDVTSLTDDQVVELFVERGFVLPPPPFGRGEISVEEDRDPTDDSANDRGGDQ